MFRVRKSMCSTCIYRPDNPLNIKALEDAVRDPNLEGYFIRFRSCHHHRDKTHVCCRGFWDRHKDSFTAGQLAQRFGMVDFSDRDDIRIKEEA